MLTLKQLKEMPAGTVFATGEVTEPRLFKTAVRWIAKRGGYHDWAIYYHLAEHTIDYVMKNGDKVTTESVIRKLVECDDEAFKWYRY